ncbi:hypothetical protein EW026_g7547 [Hermanssonia centrifuga]|uniref:Uncharacterized protein n=1 Tax=Hermanssonia centrifuga TaxID=98765 RepID=A0A4S4KBX7_9APHY|nr:hypothetical protein EW026_g7547 [Hermanssonia centrifuga]
MSFLKCMMYHPGVGVFSAADGLGDLSPLYLSYHMPDPPQILRLTIRSELAILQSPMY